MYGYQCVGLHTRFTHPGKVFLSEPVPFFLYLLDDMKVVGLCGIQQTCGLPFMFALFFRLGSELLDDFMGLPLIQTVFLTDSFDKLFTGFISFLFELPDLFKVMFAHRFSKLSFHIAFHFVFPVLCRSQTDRMGFQFGCHRLDQFLCLAGSDTLYVLYHDSFPVIRQLDVGNEVAFRTVQQLVLQCMAVGEQVFVGFG